MTNAVAEIMDVTQPGVRIVPADSDREKGWYIAPHSDRLTITPKSILPKKSPSRIQFGMIRSRRLRIIAPITVQLERKGDTVVARWEEIEEFGYGRNISESVDDFGRTIEELFFSLADQKDHLGPDLKGVFATISKYIQFRPEHG